MSVLGEGNTMNIEKVIEGLETLEVRLRGMDKRICDRALLPIAIALLRTHPDAQPNEPLTLEELREMQAKPGWLDCKYEKGWGIIGVSEFGRMISIATLNDTYFIYANGEYNDLLGAKIYLCPPKEDER